MMKIKIIIIMIMIIIIIVIMIIKITIITIIIQINNHNIVSSVDNINLKGKKINSNKNSLSARQSNVFFGIYYLPNVHPDLQNNTQKVCML